MPQPSSPVEIPSRRLSPGLIAVAGFLLFASLFVTAPNARAANIYVANYGNSTLTKVDDKGVASLVASNVDGACGAAFGFDGNIDVLDLNRGRVYRISKSGSLSVITSGLVRPEDLAFDSHGTLYTANSDGTIRTVTPEGATNILVSGLSSPRGVAFDANGNLFVSNFANGTISKINIASANVGTFATGLHGPATLAFSPGGDLYVADTAANAIAKVSPKGVVTPFASNITTPAQIAFDAHGLLYVLNSDAGTIVTVDANGTTHPFASGLAMPYGMAFDHPLLKHAPIGPPPPPPPPKLSVGLLLALVTPAILIFVGGFLWLMFRKKEVT